MNDKKYDLEERLIDFAVAIINFVETLPNTKSANHLGGQLLRSGTSPSLNYGEARSAESQNDFIHKMKIAAKEADETEYWLLLCLLSKNYPKNEQLSEKLNIIIKILSKIISTSKVD